MCRWKDAYFLVSLNVAIPHWFMNFMMTCYGYEIETKLLVGWLEVQLMSAFEVLCGQCCVRREPGLCLTAILWIARQCVAH